MTRLERILALVRRHRPGLRLVDKNTVPWMRGVGVAMMPLMPDFMTAVTVVLGDVVYLPGPPDQMPEEPLARILVHELVHQIDQARLGPLFYVSYALLLPTGRTARAHWERRAYAVDLMLAFEQGGPRGLERSMDGICRLFSGPSYGFMWAGRSAARAYLAPIADRIRAGDLQREAPYDEILAAWRG